MATSAHLQRTASAAPSSKTETAAKRDVGRLVKAIVDGLEDVKAQNLVVFDTEHLSSLFERVIVASGTSNRQTKALAASVRDAVRDAGFQKPRIEGEDNGEWIIVDCGAAVAHIMQPAIRQYYHLEDIWGEKPLRLKHAPDAKVAQLAAIEATTKPQAAKKPAAKKSSAKPATKTAAKTTAAKTKGAGPAKKVASKVAPKTAPKAPAKTGAKSVAKAATQAAAKKPAAQKSAAKKPV
jgi:ribosome-associated protein